MGDMRGVLEAQLAEGRDRLRIVVAAGEDEVAGASPKVPALPRRAPNIGRATHSRISRSRLLERSAVVEAHQPCDAGKLIGFVRQEMRLLVANHLQPVLDSSRR